MERRLWKLLCVHDTVCCFLTRLPFYPGLRRVVPWVHWRCECLLLLIVRLSSTEMCIERGRNASKAFRFEQCSSCRTPLDEVCG